MKLKLILLGILVVGLSLRLLFINNSPAALYGDELTITLDAYSLLKTGHDQLGNFLPLTFPMGAGRLAGYVYGSVPFVAIFGPSVLGVRALSILSGIGILILLYLIGKRLFGEKMGLLAAVAGAISPWDISLSRGGFEAHFALFLSLLGLYSFLKAQQKPNFYIISAISFGLAFHTYPTYKVSLLLFLPLLLWLQGIKGIIATGRKYLFGGVMILLALGILSLSQTFIGGSEARFSNINIFSQGQLKESIMQKVNLERQLTEMPSSVSEYFHNKPVEYIKVFIENYLQNFSMDFLILHGDRNPRHNMATMGEIYLADLPLILIGLLIYWAKYKKIILFLLFWVVIAPIPSAFIDFPHALRSSFMLPPLIFLSVLGFTAILRFKNKLLINLVVLLFIIQFIFFAQKLYFLAPNEYSNFWSYPAKLASQIALENKNKYNQIILSDKIDNIEFAYPVYAKVDPNLIIAQNRKKFLLKDNYIKEFDNVYIGYVPDNQAENFINSLKGSTLYISSLNGLKFLSKPEFINGLDGLSALVLERKDSGHE